MLQIVLGMVYQTVYSLSASHMYPFVHTLVVLFYTVIILISAGFIGTSVADRLVLQIRSKERRKVYRNQLMRGEIEMEQSDILL